MWARMLYAEHEAGETDVDDEDLVGHVLVYVHEAAISAGPDDAGGDCMWSELQPCDRITVLEARRLDDGELRVRSTLGWSSVRPVQPETRLLLCTARTLNAMGGITPRYHCAQRT